MFTASTIRRIGFVCLVVCLVSCTTSIASACPTCKTALAENDPAAAGMVRGYFWSILFMMSMPFLVLGSMAAYFYWEVRKARAQRAALKSSGA